MTDRNPSPPPERKLSVDDLDPNPDKIGETVISKHWLFQTLLKAIQAVEEDGSEDDPDKEAIELDKELEDEMCNLWDMSADIDIANFLQEFKARELFLGVIIKTKSPRLLEIVMGILGNMATFNDICNDFTKDSELVNTVLELTSTTDSPSLIQIVRMIHVCTVNNDAGRVWIEALKGNQQDYMTNLKNILENSLCGELLKGVLQLLYYLLDKDNTFCETERLVEPLIVAASQLISLKEYEVLDEYWYILHLLTMNEMTVKQLASRSQATFCHLQQYIEHCCNHEDILPHIHRAPALATALSVITSISSSDIPLAGIEKIYHQYLSKLLENVKAKLNREPCTSPVENEVRQKADETWTLLHDALLDLQTTINVDRS